MKKLLFILVLCLTISCSPDEDEKKDGLIGSIWYSDINGRSELKFLSDNECHLFIDYHDSKEDIFFNYESKDSHIELYNKDNPYKDALYKLEFNNKGNLSLINIFGYYMVELIRKK